MVEKGQIIEQTKLAFDFIQQLYLEVSYLVKVIEGILQEEEERFVIGRPTGYGISARSSTGLDSNLVRYWLMRKLAVFFAPEERTELRRGQTTTKIDSDLRVLYLRIVLDDKAIDEPAVYSGVLRSIRATKAEKFESLMGFIEYSDHRVFSSLPKVDYEDPSVRLQGELMQNNLFEINDTEAILKKIVGPSLELYRED